MSYLISYRLGQDVSQINIREIVEDHSYLTLHFDETVTPKVKKQIDLLVYY